MGKLMVDEDRSSREMIKKMRSLFEVVAARDENLVEGEKMTFQSMVSMFDESQKSWVDFFEKMFQEERRRRRIRRRRHIQRAPRGATAPAWQQRLLGARMPGAGLMDSMNLEVGEGTFSISSGSELDGVSLSFSTFPVDSEGERGLFYRGSLGGASAADGSQRESSMRVSGESGAARSGAARGGRRRPRSDDAGVDEAIRERSARSSAALQTLLGSLMNPAFPLLSFGFGSRQEEEGAPSSETASEPPSDPTPQPPNAGSGAGDNSGAGDAATAGRTAQR